MERAGKGWRIGSCAAFALAAAALGLAFRIQGLAGEPLWLDEAYSAFAADHGLAFIWHVVPRYETHPPLYYSLLHLWEKPFGNSLLALRLPGLLCGSLAVTVTALAAATLGRLLDTDRLVRALIAAFATALAALQPLMVQISHQVRPYPVMTLVYAIATLALLRLALATRAGLPPPRRWLVLLFVAQALMLWLHALGPLFAAALTLALAAAVLRRGLSRGDWAWLVGGQALVGIVYLPAFLILLDQAPTWVASSWLRFAPEKVPAGLATLYTLPGLAPVLAAIGAAAIATVTLVRAAAGRAAAALLVLAMLPATLALLASLTVAPVFLERTLSPVTVPMLLLFAAALAVAPNFRRIVVALLLVILLPSAWADRQASLLPPVENWPAAIRWLGPRLAPGDVVWAYPNESALPLDYALRDMHRALPVRPMPAPMPAFGWRGTYPAGGRGAPALDPDQIAMLAAAPQARRPPTIWLLSLAGGRYDPRGLMADALGRTRVEVARYKDGGIDIVGLRRRDLTARPAGPAAAAAAR